MDDDCDGICPASEGNSGAPPPDYTSKTAGTLHQERIGPKLGTPSTWLTPPLENRQPVDAPSLLSASTSAHYTNVCPPTCHPGCYPGCHPGSSSAMHTACGGARPFAHERPCLSRTRMPACSDRFVLPCQASMSERGMIQDEPGLRSVEETDQSSDRPEIVLSQHSHPTYGLIDLERPPPPTRDGQTVFALVHERSDQSSSHDPEYDLLLMNSSIGLKWKTRRRLSEFWKLANTDQVCTRFLRGRGVSCAPTSLAVFDGRRALHGRRRGQPLSQSPAKSARESCISSS